MRPRPPTSSESPPPAVYATARPGPRTRIANRVAAAARARRFELLLSLTGAHAGTRILDLGCGSLGLRALAPAGFDITGLDRAERPSYPGPFVCADVTAGLPFGEDEFDLVYCSSVIEHLEPALRERFAAELRRVGRGWFVQTPAASFPIEPHSLLPFAHWLTPSLRRRYWRLGVAGDWEPIELLGRRELAELFGGEPVAERLGPLVKSWIAARRPG